MLNNNLITKEQIADLDGLVPEHSEAIYAIMKAMYNEGYVDAAKHCYIAFGIGCVIALGIEAAKSLKKRHENKKSIVIKKD